MNRSILIVICDFLLVSLLAFSTVDINRIGETGNTPQTISLDMATNAPDTGSELASVMRIALEEERRNREMLTSELNRTRQTLDERENLLDQRENQVRRFQQEIETKEQQAARLEQQRAALSQRFSEAQTNIQALSQKLQESSLQAVISKEKLAALEAEHRQRMEAAAKLQQQLASLQQSNQMVLNERMRLATQLQVAEVEKRFAAQQVAQMQEQVKVEREERTRLAEGVKTLASKSGELSEGVKTLASKSGEISEGVRTLATRSDELTQEIRDYRPMAANAIFFDVLTNRVQARILAERSGAFGIDASKRRETETIIVTNGTNSWAICHVDDTPFNLWNPGVEWEGLAGSLSTSSAQIPIRSVSFHRRDPRLILIPVSEAEVRELGTKPYKISSDPYKFENAVLVGARDGYYGECRFQIDIGTPDYVKLDHSFIKGLFGKFNPSKGDLVFSRNGELLGVMANNNYCLMLPNFNTAARFAFSPNVRNQQTGRTLAQLYGIVQQLPAKLQ